jgi:DNA polymerase-3 subunit alpha
VAESGTHALPDVPAWPEAEKLQQEKVALGFYLSGHPYAAYQKELASFVHSSLANLKPQDQPQVLAGVVMGVRIRMTQRGKMAIVTLADTQSQVEVVVGSELLNQHGNLIKEDQLLVIEGRVSHDDFSGGVRVNVRKIYDIASARSAYANMLKISCNGQSDALKLAELLSPYRRVSHAQQHDEYATNPRGCAVKVEYHNQQAKVEVMLGEQWRVELHDDLLLGLKAWLSEENVKILYN